MSNNPANPGNGHFEPHIVGFLCNWCTYTAADTAGVSRMKQPANVDIIRVMCSGRIDPVFVLKAFAEGADGVLISGCHPPGDCHYTNGNFKTFRRSTASRRSASTGAGSRAPRPPSGRNWFASSPSRYGRWVHWSGTSSSRARRIRPCQEMVSSS
jgi:hypothetical protein